MANENTEKGWTREVLEDPNLSVLGDRFIEVVHQLSMKRVALESVRQDLSSANRARFELENSLEGLRRELEEIQNQLGLASEAARRWEDVGVGLREATSRQRLQLEVTLKEKEVLKEQNRDLQVEVMRLRRKAEEDEGRLRHQTSYYESHVKAMSKVRELQEKAESELHKLEADHSRLKEMLVEAMRRGSEAAMEAQQRSVRAEAVNKQQAALESKIIQMTVEMERMKTQPDKRSMEVAKSRNAELGQLRDLVQELESRLISEQLTTKMLTAKYEQAVRQHGHFQRLLTGSTEEWTKDKSKMMSLQADNNRLHLEVERLGQGLTAAQRALAAERERSKRAECEYVDRGVQCVVPDERDPTPSVRRPPSPPLQLPAVPEPPPPSASPEKGV